MVKTEGTVQLSIAELDNLRTQISDLTKQRDELRLHAKEVKLNITVEEEYLTTRAVEDWDAYRRDAERNRFMPSWAIPKKLESVKEKRILNQDESYIGLEEVIKELRREEEAKVIQKLGELDREILRLKNREESLKTEHKKELDKVRQAWDKQIEDTAKQHVEEVDKLKEEHTNTVKDLNKVINDLNGVVTDQTKDDTIRQLKAEIESLKLKKGFWSFLH